MSTLGIGGYAGYIQVVLGAPQPLYTSLLPDGRLGVVCLGAYSVLTLLTLALVVTLVTLPGKTKLV